MSDTFRNIAPSAVGIITAFFIILIPFRIVGYGFLPPDDALRHSAKVISGKDWSQILVLRSDIKMDSHPGWHAVLRLVHKSMGWDAHSLVLFSVIFLFILFSITPLIFLRYAESLLITLLALSVLMPGWFFRLFLGRPYILTMSFLMATLFLWPKLKTERRPYKTLIVLVALIAVSTWIHCSWYMFSLPIIAFLAAREWRAALLFSACSACGVLLGAALTGHPYLFLTQTVHHLFLSFGNHDVERLLVSEFRPGLIDASIIICIGGMLGWRSLRGKWDKGVIDNPVFILAMISLMFVFITRRVWVDWGVPAITVWMAKEFDELLGAKTSFSSNKRILITIISGTLLYLSLTVDVNARWSSSRPADYLSVEDKDQAPWLPGEGGIIYSDDMGIFYTTFFKNPYADWRYILGFEPTLMPPEDLKTYREIQRNFRTYKSFEPWVKKMRPEDRLILSGNEDCKPKIPEFEWKYTALGTWVGRTPRKQ